MLFRGLVLFNMVTREDVELLLKVQQQAFDASLKHLVDSFNEQKNELKSQIECFRSELSELKKVSNSKQVLIDSLSTKIEELEISIEGNKFDAKPINKRLDTLEDFSRRNNLRFDGIEETPGENWEIVAEKVRRIVKEKVGLEKEVEIERAHRVGQRNSEKPRTIVAKFLRFTVRQDILRNCAKLKGTNIYVNEDLCEVSLNKRKEQLEELREARRSGKIAYFVHTKLVVKEKRTDSAGTAPKNSSSQRTASTGAIPKDSKGATGGVQVIPPKESKGAAGGVQVIPSTEPKGPNLRGRNQKK